MNTLSKVTIIVAVLSSIGGAVETRLDKPSIEALMRDAAGLYASENEDFLDTLTDTMNELKFWRQKLLSERFEDKVTNLETVLSSSNNEVLNELEKYVAKYGIDGLDDSLMMRLAQLHYDRANFDMVEKMKKYDRAVTKFNSTHKGTPPVLPTPNYSRTLFFAAQLLHNFPSSPLSDRAHYLLGYCLFDEGKFEKAAKVYERLLRVHTYSDLAPESRWRLAEYYFDEGKFDLALTNYKILADSKSPFSLKALYKQGATLYARGEFSEASKVFMALQTKASAKLGSTDPEGATLYDEAIDYLAHLKAKNVELNLDDETDSLITERLAQAYRRIHDEESARKTYLKYVAIHQYSKWSPHFMNNVIESYSNENEPDKAQEVRNNFIKALNPDSPYWVKNKNDVIVTLENEDLYETHVLASAEYYADLARRTKNPKDYAAAIDYYKTFIEKYANSSLRAQALFELAELQYFAGQYPEASQSYLEVTNAVNNGDFKEEASYGYFLSQIKSVNFPLQEAEALRPQRDKTGILIPESPLTAQEKVFLKGAQFYIGAAENGNRKQKILFRAAEVFFKHNQFEKTRQALELLLKDKNKSSFSSNAIRLIALTYDLQNNWEKVTETNHRLLSFGLSSNVDDTDQEVTVRASSRQLYEAWHLENSGRLPEAAGKYEQYAISFSRTQDAPFALYRAGVTYRKTAQIAASNRMFSRLIREYPDNTYVPQAHFYKAANEESIIHFEQAAKAYEDFGRRFSKNALSTQAYLNAATLRKAMLQYEYAALDFEEYNKRTQDDEVAFQISQLYQKAGKPEQAMRIYKPYLTGKYGRDLFIRSLFERALLGSNINANEKTVRHAQEDCIAVEVAGQRYAKTLSARTLQAVAGCSYVKTWDSRNELLRANIKLQDIPEVDKRIEALFKLYAQVQVTKNNEWIAKAAADAGLILETLSDKIKEFAPEKSQEYAKRSVLFYKKAYELKDSNSTREAADFVIAGLNRFAPESVALNDEMSYWAGTGRDTRNIVATFPVDAIMAKALFDQKKWNELYEYANKANSEKETGYLYCAQAHALAEMGKWAEARQTLAICSDKLSDEDCVASYLNIGYSGPKLENYKAILAKALTAEAHSPWRLALAQIAIRQSRAKEALNFALDVVKEDPQFVPTYVFLSKVFIDAKRPELARITLDEGIKNTDGDDELDVMQGHLALNMHLGDQAQSIAEEFEMGGKTFGAARVFVSRNLAFHGKIKEAKDLLATPTVENDKLDLLCAQFYFSLLNGELKTAEDLFSKIEENSNQDPTASYLAGVYFSAFKHETEKAREYLVKAKQLGAWGKLVESLNADSNGSRTPATKEENL